MRWKIAMMTKRRRRRKKACDLDWKEQDDIDARKALATRSKYFILALQALPYQLYRSRRIESHRPFQWLWWDLRSDLETTGPSQ